MWWQFSALWLPDKGWIEPAWVEVDSGGIIKTITDIKPDAEVGQMVDAWALPSFMNCHSHAFQYAMAGLTEHLPKGAQNDDFWSWREAMYNIALKICPEDNFAIASMLYSEMVKNGISHVVEFHYVHHDPQGRPYSNLAEMSESLIAAAERTGIGLLLAPVFYQRSDFGKPALPKQRRFISQDLESYLKLWTECEKACQRSLSANIGMAIHSLRAVSEKDMIAALNTFPNSIPRHIHIAEQVREVDACKQSLGRRPVEWLLENISVDSSYNLIHATHLNQSEVKGLAQSGANVVLCPTTEGNLGDGIFPLRDFISAGGRWSLGSDSHIGTHFFEDMRLLDYTARLQSLKRNPLCKEQEESGEVLLGNISLSSLQGFGREGLLEIGSPLDLMIIDSDHPVLVEKPKSHRISALVFGGDQRCVIGTIKNAQWLCRDGVAKQPSDILKDFRKTLKKLFSY